MVQDVRSIGSSSGETAFRLWLLVIGHHHCAQYPREINARCRLAVLAARAVVGLPVLSPRPNAIN
jgi:hypothetical protein